MLFHLVFIFRPVILSELFNYFLRESFVFKRFEGFRTVIKTFRIQNKDRLLKIQVISIRLQRKNVRAMICRGKFTFDLIRFYFFIVFPLKKKGYELLIYLSESVFHFEFQATNFFFSGIQHAQFGFLLKFGELVNRMLPSDFGFKMLILTFFMFSIHYKYKFAFYLFYFNVKIIGFNNIYQKKFKITAHLKLIKQFLGLIINENFIEQLFLLGYA